MVCGIACTLLFHASHHTTRGPTKAGSNSKCQFSSIPKTSLLPLYPLHQFGALKFLPRGLGPQITGSSLQHIPALDAKPPTHDFVDLWLLSPHCQLLEASPFLELIPLPLTPTSEPHRELDAWVRKDLISKAPSALRAGHVSYHISGCG